MPTSPKLAIPVSVWGSNDAEDVNVVHPSSDAVYPRRWTPAFRRWGPRALKTETACFSKRWCLHNFSNHENDTINFLQLFRLKVRVLCVSSIIRTYVMSRTPYLHVFSYRKYINAFLLILSYVSYLPFGSCLLGHWILIFRSPRKVIIYAIVLNNVRDCLLNTILAL